jgi:hypothetical protein
MQSITYSFSIILLPCYSTAFSTLSYIIFIHRCNVFLYYLILFTFYHFFSVSCLPVPSVKPIITIMFFLFMYTCTCVHKEPICIYGYIYISGLGCTYERKHVTFVPVNLTCFGLHFHPFTCKQHNFIFSFMDE